MHTEAVDIQHLSKQLGYVHKDIQFVSVDWPRELASSCDTERDSLSVH